MAAPEFLRSDEDVEAILRIALREGTSPTDDLEGRLRDSARELGISEETLSRAIERYRSERSQSAEEGEREALRRRFSALRRRDFLQHLGVYAAVNGGLFLLFALKGVFPGWLPWVFFGWGIGVVAHLVAVFFPGTDEEREFEHWVERRR